MKPLCSLAGEKFTALWENVTLKEDSTKNFTFAATLYKNGDITFAYKHIPIPVQDIDEDSHPVKVGISDAYQTERIMFCKCHTLGKRVGRVNKTSLTFDDDLLEFLHK